MKHKTLSVLLGLFLFAPDVMSQSQVNGQRQSTHFPQYERAILLETTSERSANAAFGDLNGDGNLDIVLAKGRHWPLVNRVLLGDGTGGILLAYDLAKVANRSYSGQLADMDGDGDLDVVVSNDRPDPNLVYINDGEGKFAAGSEFGRAEWPTRNASVGDVNGDGFPDIIVANRSRDSTIANYLCINNGDGTFEADCMTIAAYPATTITAADFNNDGLLDLAVPHRNGGQSYVLIQTTSDGLRFRQVPFGPTTAAVRMAQAGDFDNDGRMDIVTIDTRRGVIIHFQKEVDIFSAGKFIGNQDVRPYALAVGDLNLDGAIDIIVGNVEAPSVIHFNDEDGKDFIAKTFGDGRGTVYGFDIGDFNKDGQPDIAAARSGAENIVYLGDNPGQHQNNQ